MSWFKIRCTIESYAFGFRRLGGEFFSHQCKKEHVPFCLFREQVLAGACRPWYKWGLLLRELEWLSPHGWYSPCVWTCRCSQPDSVKAWPLLGTDMLQEISQLLLIPFAHSHCLWPVQHVFLLHSTVQKANKICLDIPSSHLFPSHQIGLITTFGWQLCKL